MNENCNLSYLMSSKEPVNALHSCTSCCPFDIKNLPHPQFIYPSITQTNTKQNEIIANSDACCLSKLQVDCRIQCHKKKKKKKKHENFWMKNKPYDSIHSSQGTKRTISSTSSSTSQLSPNYKKKKFSSSNHINSHYQPKYDCDSQTSLSSSSSNTNTSEITEQSYLSNKSRREYNNKSTNAQPYHRKNPSNVYLNQNLKDLKSSIDNLTQLIIHQQNPSSQISFLSNRLISSPFISFFDKFRRFFTLFKSSSKSTTDEINDQCSQILKQHHLTKQNLLNIYNHLFDKNEKLFLNWLRTLIPEYFLPSILNYVKHLDSTLTDNE